MDSFFELIDGEIKFNDGVVMNIPIVRKIIRRDRGGKIVGDPDGRLKLFAKAELTYAWYVVNVASPAIIAGLSGKELHDKSVLDLGLPADWQPDDMIKEFIKVYANYHDTIVVKTIKQLLKGFDIIFDSNDVLLNVIKSEMRKPNKSVEDIADINKAQKEIMSTSSNLPKMTEELKLAMVEFNSIEESFGKGLGGIVITSSMMPDND